jgi:DNA adenine methylase
VTVVTRPVMRWHGGKWRLAPWIISHFPPHRTYVEPFGGAASVLLRKPRAYAEIYNDTWRVAVDVFRVLRDPAMARELERRLRLTPFSRDEFKSAYIAEDDDIVERARKAIVRSFMGFGSASTNGKHLTGFRANSRRSGTTPALDWQHYPDMVAAFTERLQGVVIENKDYSEVIAQHDAPDTLIYCDPPYPHETRNMRRGNAAYAHEFRSEDHERMAEQLRSCASMVIVSTYPNKLYDRIYAGWVVSEIDAYADGARPRREVLYLNPAAAKAQRQPALPLIRAAIRSDE